MLTLAQKLAGIFSVFPPWGSDPLCSQSKPYVWSYVQRQPTCSAQPHPDETPVSSRASPECPSSEPRHSTFSSACSPRAKRVSSGVLSQIGGRGTGGIRQSPSLQDIREKGENGWFWVVERQRLIRYYNILETSYVTIQLLWENLMSIIAC